MNTHLLVVVCLACLWMTQIEASKFEKEFLQKIDQKDLIYVNYGNKKILRPIGGGTSIISNLNGGSESRTGGGAKSKVDILSRLFKNSVNRLRQKTKRVDLVFLIDSSSSVGKSNFMSEIKFVKKMLADFNVSYNYTRVAIVTFSSQGKIIRHIDHISVGREENDKCRLLNYEIPKIYYVGGGTYTYGALKEAKDIFAKARKHSRKLICLITDGFSNGKNPVPIAQKLKADNVTIVTFGIQTGNYAELYNISSAPGEEHSFLLDSFTQFESLARKALHSDYKMGNSIRLKNPSYCDILCDKPFGNETSCCDLNAECTCGTTSGHYGCVCDPGYYGSGLVDKCTLCPNGTYWHNYNLCKPCPDAHHITLQMPAVNASFCVCKSGFKSQEDNRCEVITCPQLEPPDNGYFVKHPTGCGHVLNAACGSRCKSGYQLSGSSIRLCQENGTWSGIEANCDLKTCPRLSIPYYGMVTCKNSDLNLFFDYTPRNETFMMNYDRDEMRITEAMPIDTDCNFKCGSGFYMVGSGMRNCLPLSKWDGLQTTCKQILCSPLPKITSFGVYEPTDCSEQKVSHGSNCSLICPLGFEIKGPSTKSCSGKRTGVWSNKNKTPKCVDIQPPSITCPLDYIVPLDDENNYALVTNIQYPIVSDNSDLNVTFWIKPAVKSDGVKLTLGDHLFTYVAVDTFKNKAKCNFTISVVDRTAPVMDNCIDPPRILIPTCGNILNRSQCFIEWEDPIIYDNSNAENIFVNQSLEPGYLGVGVHRVQYVAVDNAGNANSCTLNVTVQQLQCEVLASPRNGHAVCARNVSHTWCEITCDVGYAIYDELEDNHLDHFKLHCDNIYAKWKYELIPDCTVMELPNAVEQIFSISLDSETAVCNDTAATAQIRNEISEQVRQQLCGDDEQCTIVSNIPDCIDSSEVIDLNDESSASNTFYKVVKRETGENVKPRNKGRQRKTQLKVRLFTKISKKLGLWNRNVTRSENIKRVKLELRNNLQTNEKLRSKLIELKINLKSSIFEELVLCRNGSVAKRHMCLQCPRGTFHDVITNTCKPCPLHSYIHLPGQMVCLQCPEFHSTRKTGSQSATDCKQQCPPGTIARLKASKNSTSSKQQRLQRSFMPFCRKCYPNEFQPKYDQIACEKCPDNYISPRGSMSRNDCLPKRVQPCISQPTVCGQFGVCIPETRNPYLYSCHCAEGYVGSHCEHQLDPCMSLPCQNGGTCHRSANTTAFMCRCSDGFYGETCENGVDKCSDVTCANGGWCVEAANGQPTCECTNGYEGEFCEKQLDFCAALPCESGVCLNTAEGYLCRCPPGVIGRRCHLRPCDYFPCHKNAICVDLLVFPASRNSFVCRCPKGLKGYDCSQILNPCETNACKNNAECFPLALRDTRVPQQLNGATDDVYEQFRCVCPPYFYGKFCEILTTPDFVMEFTKSGISDYVEMSGPSVDLTEISLCVWVQTNDAFNYGTIVSYATDTSDNMFTLTDYNGFVLYVNGTNIVTDININDGLWHYVCVAWTSQQGFYEVYMDGGLHQTGYNLSANSLIQGNGTLIVGQEQDSLGTSFSESESFVGKIAYMDVWDRFLGAQEVLDFYSSCEPIQGNLFAWSDFKNNIRGSIKISESPFCKPCSTELFVQNGIVRFLGNRAFYHCYEGYKVHGSISRDCLRTSEWSLPEPQCRTVSLHQQKLSNGEIVMTKTAQGDAAIYRCNDGYHLINGTSAGSTPECISNIQCDGIEPSPNMQVMYANERGQITSTGEQYPVGTFAELTCLNATYINGESFLTCLDTSMWDYPVARCVNYLPTTSIGPTTEDLFPNKISENLTSTAFVEFTAKVSILNVHITTTTDSTTEFQEASSTDTPTLAPISQIPPTAETTTTTNQPNDFWEQLKKFYYYGCASSVYRNISILCQDVVASEAGMFSDLSSTEMGDSTEFQNMDTKLLRSMNRAISYISSTTAIEDMFDLILYGDEELTKLPASVKNSYRLVLCFFIDVIIADTDLSTTELQSNDNNTTHSIRMLLQKLFNRFREEYLGITIKSTISADRHTRSTTNEDIKSVDTMSTSSTTSRTNFETTAFDETTISYSSSEMSTSTLSAWSISTEAEEPRCTVHLLSSKMPINSIIQGIGSNTDTIVDINLLVEPNTTAYFSCKDGYELSGIPYSKCNEAGVWGATAFACEPVINALQETCENPPRPVNMDLIGRKLIHKPGDRLQLQCKEGFITFGHSIVKCLPNAKWSKVMSRCSKISCNKPNLPVGADITAGNSYLYNDKLNITCENKKINEIECQSNGIWEPSDICNDDG